ncbi:MAG: HIRAN domain-containing protein [Chitinophagales bacterium]|nr:HIRAN domain-containing protein [Chitinophagales bacterium]
MKRSDFIKTLGLGAGGLILPNNPFVKSKEIKIYDNYVKGITHYQYKKIRDVIKEGDKLILKRDVENKYDSFAIRIFYNEFALGYIAAYENIILANMIDAGVELKAYVSAINLQTDIYNQLSISVYAELIIANPKLIASLLSENRADDAPDIYRNNGRFFDYDPTS